MDNDKKKTVQERKLILVEAVSQELDPMAKTRKTAISARPHPELRHSSHT